MLMCLANSGNWTDVHSLAIPQAMLNMWVEVLLIKVIIIYSIIKGIEASADNA